MRSGSSSHPREGLFMNQAPEGTRCYASNGSGLVFVPNDFNGDEAPSMAVSQSQPYHHDQLIGPPLSTTEPPLNSDEDDDIFFFKIQNHADNVKPEEIDLMVAKEMSSLSMLDREKVYFDIHGVSGEIKETPDVIQNHLKEMEDELNNLDGVPAYKRALAMDPEYVRDKAFRLKFLRAESFDIKQAAQRFGRHFQAKLELFGKDLLVKDIIQDVLDKETMHVAYSAYAQALPIRDRAGRLVNIQFMQPTNVAVKAKLRYAFYAAMIISEDEETQRKGCIIISYLIGEKFTWLHDTQHRREWNLKVGQLLRALPVRNEAIHVYHDSLTWKVLLALFKASATLFSRVRMREHYGSRQECMFSLQTFGVPTQDFPIDANGNIMTERHKSGMEKRRRLERLRQSERAQAESGESTDPATVRVGLPGRSDILLGRGKASYQHIGNVRLRNLIQERAPAYEEANTAEKQRMSGVIVSLIQESTGHFLKYDGISWVEVPENIARKKVSHAFRTFRSIKGGNTSAAKHHCEDDDARGIEPVSFNAMKRGRAQI